MFLFYASYQSYRKTPVSLVMPGLVPLHFHSVDPFEVFGVGGEDCLVFLLGDRGDHDVKEFYLVA